MSDFVDYTKRAVTLPTGCKDLIDVLTLTTKPGGHFIEQIEKLGGPLTSMTWNVALRGLGVYVSKLCSSRAKWTQFIVSAPGDTLTVSLDRTRTAENTKMVLSVMTKQEEEKKLVRSFLQSKGFGPPVANWLAEIPVQLVFPVPALQSESWVLSCLLIEFFKVVCGLSEDAELRLRFTQIPG